MGKSSIERAFNILRCDMCSLKRALEPAVRFGLERTTAGARYGVAWHDYGKKPGKAFHFQLKNGRIWGCESGKTGADCRWRPERVFGNEEVRLEFTEVRKNSPKGWVCENSEPSTASGP